MRLRDHPVTERAAELTASTGPVLAGRPHSSGINGCRGTVGGPSPWLRRRALTGGRMRRADRMTVRGPQTAWGATCAPPRFQRAQSRLHLGRCRPPRSLIRTPLDKWALHRTHAASPGLASHGLTRESFPSRGRLCGPLWSQLLNSLATPRPVHLLHLGDHEAGVGCGCATLMLAPAATLRPSPSSSGWHPGRGARRRVRGVLCGFGAHRDSSHSRDSPSAFDRHHLDGRRSHTRG